MDRPKRKTKLPAKLLESEQILNKKKVHKVPKSEKKTEVYLSKETEVDLSKEKEVDTNLNR